MQMCQNGFAGCMVVSDVHTWQVVYGNVGAKTLQGSNLMPEFWL